MSKRLQHETSPYLQQHANNPVDWYPWGKEALDRAREQNKPILLSIGYSSCHWCHVMAHESFEDEATAELMNRLFINIKVDREERPDLDKIYQRAHQLLTQRPGGWPLTVFLMPDDQVPFFAGTYFPNEARHRLPSFKSLLQRIADFYTQHLDQLQQQNQALMQAMQMQANTPEPDAPLSAAPLDMARRQLEDSIDWQHGGFGTAPKFPHPTNTERLLRHWASSREDTRALQMACHNLLHMAHGGINDQLGGGFCRYSVDDYWMIPHFEKMLYDNGPLLTLYSEAWSATQEPLFLELINSTANWVLREMQSPEGGYYSSLDADSEGEEGKFYAWTTDEIRSLLENDEYDCFIKRFGIDQSPNFEGKYYPYVNLSWEAIADADGSSLEQLQALVKSAKIKLFTAREQRIRPGRDEKVLCSWNALMIKGMASAGRHLGNDTFIDSAYAALDFIKGTLWQDKRLLASFKDGHAHLNAYLDDYVYLIDAILELLQARWRDGELAFAQQLADIVLEQFEDKGQGGFFFTSKDHEQLIERPKGYGDEAMPSGNGIAATVLQRLAHITGELTYGDAAERALKDAWPAIQQIPYAHNAMLAALEEWLNPPQIIVTRGDAQAIQAWHERVARPYAPRRICLSIPDNATDLPGLLASREARADMVVAYVCNGSECQAPISEMNAFNAVLLETEACAQLKLE